MYRNSFKDMDGKVGKVGSKVIQADIFAGLNPQIKTVKNIISKGRGGTRITFEEGDYGKPRSFKIIEE